MPSARSAFMTTIALFFLVQAGCSDRASRNPEPQPAAEPEPARSATGHGTEAPPSSTASATPGTEASAPSPESAPPPETRPQAAPEPADESTVAPAPAGTTAGPAAPIEVAATKPGLSRIGADKCKTCHKIQYDSWAASQHAARTPVLDCESCHGPGSEYRVLAVMKDPVKAREAGLVIPGREFCATCHQANWSDDMLARVHAHKQK